MATINKLVVTDATGAPSIGNPNSKVKLTMFFDEALTITGNTLNGANFSPTFTADNSNLSNVSFVAYDAARKSVTFTATLPDVAATAISLTTVALSNNIALGGKKGTFAGGTLAPSVLGTYTIDKVAPTFTSADTIAAFTENAITNKTAIYTAAATDINGVIYSLGGTDAKDFNIARNGVVTFKNLPDADTKSNYSFNVIATDKAGNTGMKSLTLTVAGADEKVVLAKGVKGTGTITLVKGATVPAGLNVAGDFFNPEGTSGMSFTHSAVGATVAGVTFTNGTLSGTPTVAGNYKFTIKSDDSQTNGVDASRAYTLVVLSKPVVESMTVTDAAGLTDAGVSKDAVAIKVTLSEALTETTATGIVANFYAGKRALTGVTQGAISSVEGKGVISFTGTLPEGDSSSIALTALSLGTNTLKGTFSEGTLSGRLSGLKVQGSYRLDNSAPKFTSATKVTFDENISANSAVYTAAASDANSVTYSLSGSDSSFFNINASSGVVSIKAPANFEDADNTDHRYSVTISATDALSHASNRVVNLYVRDLNEPSVLKAGVSGNGSMKFVKGLAQTETLASDFADPERRALTYKISDGWLTPGLSLNAKTGVISGTPQASLTAGNYTFTVTADDGVENGTDASRSYSLSLSETPLLSASDIALGTADSQVVFTARYPMVKGSKLQIVKGASNADVGNPITLTASAGVQTITLDKTAMGIADNSSADFKVKYLANDSATALFSDAISITEDKVAPTVVSPISLSASGVLNGFLNAGDELSVHVTFSEVMSNLSAASITSIPLQFGSGGTLTAKTATFASINQDAKVATYKYTVLAGDTDADGVSINAGTFTGVTLTDLAGNAIFNNIYPALDTQANFKVDTTAPTITGNPASGTALTRGTAVALADLTFSDNEAGTLSLSLLPTNGTLTGLTDADPTTTGIQLNGLAAALDTAFAAAQFNAAATGTPSLSMVLRDEAGNTSTVMYNFAALA